VTFFR